MNGKSRTSSLCSFRGLDVLAAIVVVAIASIAKPVVAGEAVELTEMYVPYNLDGNYADAESFAESFLDSKSRTYAVDDPKRQHLHLFQNPSDKPTPVFFFSHNKGGIAEDVSEYLDVFAAAGYSVISWETSTTPRKGLSMQDFETPWADFELVWLWFQENAASYNFDADFAVIGGHSRGTMCSWIMAHSGKPAIKGIYMYNVLPDPYWSPQAKEVLGNFWEEAVTTNSPKTHLVFKQECPKPISQDCEPSPNHRDIHNPRNGQTIVDKYTELGIGSKIQLTDGLAIKGIHEYDLFPEFAASLSASSAGEASQSAGKDYSSSTGAPADSSLGSSAAAGFPTPVPTSSAGEDSSSILTVGLGSSVTTVTSSNQTKILYLSLTIISFCCVWAAFRYGKYFKLKQPSLDQTELEKMIIDNGELSKQDVGKSSYRDFL